MLNSGAVSVSELNRRVTEKNASQFYRKDRKDRKDRQEHRKGHRRIDLSLHRIDARSADVETMIGYDCGVGIAVDGIVGSGRDRGKAAARAEHAENPLHRDVPGPFPCPMLPAPVAASAPSKDVWARKASRAGRGWIPKSFETERPFKAVDSFSPGSRFRSGSP